MKKFSTQHSFIAARAMATKGPLVLTGDQIEASIMAELPRHGINLSGAIVRQMLDNLTSGAGAQFATDSLEAPLLNPSIMTPLQFLQAWLPGFVRVLTTARKADELMGIATVGAWEDEEIVQGMLEPIGQAVPYTDYGSIPFSSFNPAWTARTVTRWEHGFRVGLLEEARAGRVNISSAGEKRNASTLALDIVRNRVAFFGYNGGANQTFGMLNDPNLLPYETAIPSAAAGNPTTWADKTFLEITRDLRFAFSTLRTQSGDVIDIGRTQLTLAIASNCYDYLTVTGPDGLTSVIEWLRQSYPTVRLVSVPEYNEANGGENIFYLYAESVDDGSSDDSRVITQLVPSRFFSLGSERRAKNYIEDFSNATAGALVKRPWAVVRMTGI